VAGTDVSTPNGRVAIETITVGDLVYAWDARRDALAVTRVLCLETHEDETVEIFDLGFGIRVTKCHPFWTGTEWIKSENVRRGVSLLAIAGARSIATFECQQAQQRTVYNVRTEAGTYLVGAVGAVVSGLRAEDELIVRAA
jgi:hypothetical protein